MKVSTVCRFNGLRGLYIAAVVLALISLQVICALATPGRRSECANNLMQIGLAIRNYDNVYRRLPARVTRDETGNSLQSWRTLILPYLERRELFEHCELREPWNSPRNNFLLGEEIALFRCPYTKGGNAKDTCYVAVGGAGTAWDRVGRLERIPGTAKMILVIEMKNSGIHWAEPRDLDLDNLPKGVTKQNLLETIANHERGTFALFADGHVQFIEAAMPWEEFMALLVLPDKTKVKMDCGDARQSNN
jgi:prepilin-type processing-associated H-X9-DG protein